MDASACADVVSDCKQRFPQKSMHLSRIMARLSSMRW